MENTYIDFLFEDEDSGEQFFVEIKLEANGSYKEARKKAIEIANENFIVLIQHWFRYDCAASPETITTYYFSLISQY